MNFEKYLINVTSIKRHEINVGPRTFEPKKVYCTYIGCSSWQWGSSHSTSYSYDVQAVSSVYSFKHEHVDGWLLKSEGEDFEIININNLTSFLHYSEHIVNYINLTNKLLFIKSEDRFYTYTYEYKPYRMYMSTHNLSHYTWKGMTWQYSATTLRYNYNSGTAVTYAAGCSYSRTIYFPSTYIDTLESKDSTVAEALPDSIVLRSRGQSGRYHPGWGSADFYYAYLPSGMYDLI